MEKIKKEEIGVSVVEEGQKEMEAKDDRKEMKAVVDRDIINNIAAVTEIIKTGGESNVSEIQCIPEKKTITRTNIGVAVKAVTVGVKVEVEVIRTQSLYIKYK